MMKNNRRRLVFGLLACLMAAAFYVYGNQEQVLAALSPGTLWGGNLETEREDGYFTVKDEDGRQITATALPVFVGDEFIGSDNRHYRVIKIQGDTALAKFLGIDQIAYDPAWDEDQGVPAATGAGGNKIAVYHTHSDESYVPTDGKSSIYGNGGIFKVGNAYVKALKEQGVNAIHSTRPHDPHDANAYHRSRRTAVELLKQRPTALVDVHRDAVPADVYRKTVEGKEVTQVKLVVGRRNPTMKENLKFAQNIKAYLDKRKPGMIEGIFIAKGNYNQDLSPRAILIEVGSHTNSRLKAQDGMAMFSEAIPRVAGVPVKAAPGAGPGTPATPNTTAPGFPGGGNLTSWSTLGWIVGAVIIGVGAFLLISTGSVKGSWDKVKSFTGQEFANALLRRKDRKQK